MTRIREEEDCRMELKHDSKKVNKIVIQTYSLMPIFQVKEVSKLPP